VGGGVEATRVSVPYGDTRVRDSRVFPDGFIGAGLDLKLARATYVGASFRMLVMGTFTYDRQRLDMSAGWVTTPTPDEVFDATPGLAAQGPVLPPPRAVTMRARLIAITAVLAAACAAPPPPSDYAWALPPRFQPPPVPADNPMSAAKVELGRRLFYDVRLAANGTQACASCHAQARAFTDGRATSVGSTGEVGRRNAQPLANVGYLASLTWANPSMRALEAQAHVPMFGVAPVELGVAGDGGALLARLADEPLYPALFAEAFPDDPAPLSIANLTRAIASFERTIVSGRARVDRGELTTPRSAVRRCSASPRLGCAQLPRRLRVHGRGRRPAPILQHRPHRRRSRSRRRERSPAIPRIAGWFRPPSLRNVAVTAPYLHDGSVATLEEVIDLYAAGRSRRRRQTTRARASSSPASRSPPTSAPIWSRSSARSPTR
jgi:cytochrome c peroxidase